MISYRARVEASQFTEDPVGRELDLICGLVRAISDRSTNPRDIFIPSIIHTIYIGQLSKLLLGGLNRLFRDPRDDVMGKLGASQKPASLTGTSCQGRSSGALMHLLWTQPDGQPQIGQAAELEV